jgi:Protein of unknown function (DUF3592)
MFFRRIRQWPPWKRRLFFGLTFTGTGTAFLAVSCGLLTYEAWFVAHSRTTPGKISANIEQQTAADPGTNTTATTCFRPQFQYVTADGTLHNTTGSICSSPASFSVGESVTIRYLQLNQDHAQIDSFGEEWGFSLVFGLVGLVAVPGLFMLRRVRKEGHPIDIISLWE